jgi:hypothetical protein
MQSQSLIDYGLEYWRFFTFEDLRLATVCTAGKSLQLILNSALPLRMFGQLLQTEVLAYV